MGIRLRGWCHLLAVIDVKTVEKSVDEALYLYDCAIAELNELKAKAKKKRREPQLRRRLKKNV